MFSAESLFSIVLAFAVVTASPGPANIATATVAMRRGRRNSLIFGAGLAFGLAFWGVIAATGMGAVLQGSVRFLMALKILGGLYLLWLAFQSGRSALRASGSGPRTMAEGQWFLRGLILNLSNPKAVVAWMAALSMGMGADSGSGQVMLATAICMALGFANYTAYAMAFSLPGFMAGYQRFRRWIEGVVAALFATAGFALIRSALAR
ncbi:MAG: LysE family transporter [Rhodobiaceae bacterium]|nr:LysE family transporter [Rhodobiaceae bacterium]MCC0018363.1 LysE family transporter [Rhodobiaceae bacterium]MCC0051156.1 LysE family transporter [Rhodobiaceae bacterium]MCC0060221.1 LysE family transporter [Rhodobiaceae bacterium]